MKRCLGVILSFAVAFMLLFTGIVAYASESDNGNGNGEALILNFKDTLGNTLKSVECVAGEIPDTSDINATVFDSESGSVTVPDGWYWRLDGENETKIRALTADEISALAGETVEIYPKTSEHTLNTFAIYTVDSFGIKRLSGQVSDYAQMSYLKQRISSAPDEAVVVLLYDKDTPYEIGGSTVYSIPKGKTMSFDLNGRVMVQSFGSTSGYGYQIFSVGEGTTFNLYSSKEGGAFFQAKYHSGNDKAWASGIISIAANTDSATVNVGNVYGDDGKLLVSCASDFAVYGGTLVFVNKADDPDGIKGNGKIEINVNGGYYYHALRSGYAIFTLQTPDVYINLKDAVFYNNNNTYTVFHDYKDTSSNTYKTETHIEAYNCDFVCMSSADGSYYNLFHNMNKESTAYFEDCLIMANAGSANGKITLGGGNIVSGNIYGSKTTALAPSVDYAKHNGIKAEKELTFPPLYYYIDSTPAPIVVNSDGKYLINPEVLDRENWIYDKKFEADISCVTYEEGKTHSRVKPVEWFDLKGESLGVEPWAVGSKLVHSVDNVYKMSWYGVACTWQTEDGTDATDYIVSAEGDNNMYAVSDRLVASIDGKLANLYLYNDFVFNLYLPIEPLAEGVTVSSSNGDVTFEKEKVDGVEMYVIRWRMPLGSFESNDVTVKYTLSSTDIIEISEPCEFEYTVSLNLISYVEQLMDDMSCGSNLTILLYSLMNYQVASAKHLNEFFTESDVQGLSEFYAWFDNEENHKGEECTCFLLENKNSLSESEINTSYDALLKKGVKSIDFVPEKNGLLNLVIKLSDANTKIIRVSSENAKKETVQFELEFSKDKKTVTVKDISAYYLNGKFTVVVEDKEAVALGLSGESCEAVGEYCLGKYIDDYIYENYDSYEDSTLYAVIRAFYVYAKSAKVIKPE